MIARIWKGETPELKADQYFDFLKATGIKDYRETKGNQGVLVLRRKHEGTCRIFLAFPLGILGCHSRICWRRC